MSLLSPERFRIALGSSYAAMAELKSGVITSWHMQTLQDTEQVSWQSSLAIVTAWLQELAPRKAKADVVLSTELAPLQLLPWRDDASQEQQQLLIAGARYRSIFGKAADTWQIRLRPTGYGKPWLAAATDTALMQAMSEQWHALGVSPASITPLPVSLYNALRGRLRDSNGWLLAIEHRHLTAIHWRDGHWRLLRTLPLSILESEGLAHALDREIRLAGMQDVPATVYLAGPSAIASSLRSDCVALDSDWECHASIPQNIPLSLLGGRA